MPAPITETTTSQRNGRPISIAILAAADGVSGMSGSDPIFVDRQESVK